MADNIDIRELQEAMEQLRRAVGSTAIDFDALDAELKQNQVGMKAFKKALKDTPAQLTKGLGSFAKTVADGDTSLKAMNGVIDTASNALAGMAKAIPFAGDALAAGVQAVGEASKFVLNQLDATAKVFNEFGQVGALGVKGISGLAQQFNRSGMSMQGFQKAITENASALARFRGLASDGAEDFSKVVGGIVDSNAGLELRRLGMSADQIGSTAAAFVTQQTRLGRSQAMTQEQLRQGTVQYARELDELSKLTGMNKEAIQKQQDAALSETKFRSVTEQMIADGRVKEAEALRNLQTVYASFDAEIGQGVRDLSSGIANTDAAIKLFNSTGGKAADIIDRLKNGQISQEQAQLELQAAFKENKKNIIDMGAAVGDTVGVYNKAAAVSDIANAEMVKGVLTAKKTQKEQMAGTDELTEATVTAQQNLEQMNRKFYQLGFQLMPSAAKAVEGFTSALNKFIDFVGEKLGIEMPGTAAARAKSSGAYGGGYDTAAQHAAAPAKSVMKYNSATGQYEDVNAGNPYAGLKLKQGDVTGGGDVESQLLSVARIIQGKLGADFGYFSAFNDRYHNEKAPASLHTQGRAMDFTIADPSKAAEIAAMVKGIPGISRVDNEYANLSAHGTGGHIHAEISARNGFSGMLSGPSSGYRPNLTMHGTEQISISPTTTSGSASPNSDNGLLRAQLDRLEELVGVMKNQVSVSTKILQMQS